jgi:hypothetical protein
VNHPAVTRLTSLLAILVKLTSTEQESLLGVQNVNVLDARLEAFSGLEEEGNLSLAELTLTHGDLTVDDGVKDNAVLTGGKGSQGNLTNDALINVGNVSFGILEGDEPLLTGLALDAKDVSEGLEGLKLKSLLLSQNEGRDGLDDLLVDVGEVSTGLTNKPLLTSLAGYVGLVGELLTSTETESLIGLDNNGANNLDDLDLNARNVGTRALEEPLITSQSLHLGISLGKITDGTETEGSVGGNNLERGDLSVELLTGVQREGILYWETEY